MIPAIALALVVAIGRPPVVRARQRLRPSSEADLTRLLLVATSSGLPLGSALDRIGADLVGPIADAVLGVVRRSRQLGLHNALVGAEIGGLAPVLARSHSSGSPIVPTLQAHLATLNARRVAVALERARTAPVKLMPPLVLLLLPGFVALVLGPGIVDQIADLGGVVP